MKNKPIKIFECYAGYGGASFALQKANIPYEIVGYSETHKGQIKIYEQNHYIQRGEAKLTPFNYGDITKINPKYLPDFDLITGGFPCQDVSIAGLRDLKKGRTTSVFKMLDIIQEKKPKYCLLENVQGIMSMHNGELLREIVRKLKGMGYAVSYELLYSKDYGNPQLRPRVWIACELDRSSFMFNPFPKKEELNLFVEDLLEENVDESYYLSQTQIDRIIRRSEIRGKPLGKRINPKICHTIHTKKATSSPADSIFIDSNVASTIVAGDYSHMNVQNQFLVEKPIIHSLQPRSGDPKKGGTGHLSREEGLSYTIDTGNTQAIEKNNSIRTLTPKECFRLMGFHNDEINIDGIAKTTAYFSAGNGWDVNLVSKIFQRWFQ